VISSIDAGIDLASAVPSSPPASSSSKRGGGGASAKGNAKGDTDTATAEGAVQLLERAIGTTTGVEGRDVELLQRVIVKEGEGRMALAALLWSTGQRQEAETVLGDACLRLDQLQAQLDVAVPTAAKKLSTKTAAVGRSSDAAADEARLRYSIDDDLHEIGPRLTCGRFRGAQFGVDKLGWSQSLQDKLNKLEALR
jgi:hypothetical protein